MFDVLLSGILSFWSGQEAVKPLRANDWSTWLNAVYTVVGQPQVNPDPAVEAIIQQHLRQLERVGMPASRQGILVQTSNQIIGQHQGEVALSAASLTKVATTLAALDRWDVNHQFETIISATGPIQDGVLQGDLIVIGGGDPFFVWEEAVTVGNRLNELGIRRVAGNLIVVGDFLMNFKADPAIAGSLLKQGLNFDAWNAEAARQFRTLPAGTARPQVVIEGEVQVAAPMEVAQRAPRHLIRHRSLPLSQILKGLNTYSNNVMSDALANKLGGATVVAQRAAEISGVPIEEIRLINGSGLGMENQISSRTVVAMLIAIQRKVQSQNMNVADLFPVIGRDRGTLGSRPLPVGAAVKTGTLDAVSSLAGVIPTRDRGLIWFSIINVGTADLNTLHNLQDDLVQQLQQYGGVPSERPTALTPGDFGDRPENQLGAPERSQIL